MLPLFLGGALLVPLGVWLLTILDPGMLRHGTALAILVLVAVMAAGWRYRGRSGPLLSFGVGAASGLMGGAIGISGPPVILFWLGGQADAAMVRANVIAYFGLMTVVSAASLWLNHLFTREVLLLSLVLTPVYALSVWAGAHGFRFASERLFRWLSLLLIAAVALAALFS